MQKPRFSARDNPEIYSLIKIEFFFNRQELLFKIGEIVVFGGTQVFNGISSLLDQLSEQFINISQSFIFRSLRRQIMNFGVKLHFGADESLQKRIVKIARNARAFRKAFLKLKI